MDEKKWAMMRDYDEVEKIYEYDPKQRQIGYEDEEDWESDYEGDCYSY